MRSAFDWLTDWLQTLQEMLLHLKKSDSKLVLWWTAVFFHFNIWHESKFQSADNSIVWDEMREISKYQGHFTTIHCSNNPMTGPFDNIGLKASEQLVDIVGPFPSVISWCRQLSETSSWQVPLVITNTALTISAWSSVPFITLAGTSPSSPLSWPTSTDVFQ